MRGAMMLVWCAACGASETKFLVKGLPMLCEAASECAGIYDAAACEDDVRAEIKACDYSPPEASECIRALKRDEGSCDVDATLGTSVFTAPEPCDLIYAEVGGNLVPARTQ